MMGADGLAVHEGARRRSFVGEEDPAALLPDDAGVAGLDVGGFETEVTVGPGAQEFLEARRLQLQGVAVPRSPDDDEERLSRLLGRGIDHKLPALGASLRMRTAEMPRD
jgi:hypothetical protein